MNVQGIIQIIERLAPKDYAFYPDDNNGLLVGDFSSQVNKVLLALDLTEEVLNEAIESKCQMIVTHHPFIFKGIKNIRMDNVQGRILSKAIKEDINIYAAHTNLDVAQLGVNEALRRKLDMKTKGECSVLQPTMEEKYYKLVVYVPDEDTQEVMEAVSRAGAGHIGNYSHCSFQTEGRGTFTPLSGANPTIGTVGKMEYVKETKLETIVPTRLLKTVIKAMEKAHPYEEVAYDILPLVNQTKAIGLGKIIELENPIDSQSLAEHVIHKLGCQAVKLFGSNDQIKKIAICGGSGSSVIHTAKFSGCQVLITGDVDYHKGQMAVDLGLVVIDAGHYHTEVPVLEDLQKYMNDELNEVETLVTKHNTCPYRVVGSTW